MSRPAYVSSGSEMIPVEQDLHFSRHLSIREELTSLPIPKHPDKTVYVMHSPPRDSTLDRMFNGKSAGSAAIREFIEERRPYLALHGHIHEAPEKSGRYADWIDRTLCVNPGHHPDHLFAVWLDLEEAPGTIRHSHFDPEG
jgi:Icc-related predicted phosphoesterase